MEWQVQPNRENHYLDAASSRALRLGIDADLDKLRALLAEIDRSLNGAPKFRRVAFSKGFDPPKGC
jgi:hypothetical protein